MSVLELSCFKYIVRVKINGYEVKITLYSIHQVYTLSIFILFVAI